MDNVDLTHAMQEMIAEMTAMRAELTDLKARADVVTPPTQQKVAPVVSTTRRTALRRLAGGLLAGLGVAGVAATLPEQAEAKITARAGRTGAIISPANEPVIGDLSGSSTYKWGLVAFSGLPNRSLSQDDQNHQANTAIVGYSDTTGVYGNGNSTGVYGKSTYIGVYGKGNTGVYGSGTENGVYGEGPTAGVLGFSPNTGVYGNAGITGVFGNGGTIGVHGRGRIGTAGLGILASLTGTLPISTKIGLFGNADIANLNLSTYDPNTQIAVYGKANIAANNYAGLFEGNVSVYGTLSKSGGTFKIDHPLDPANKYLYHSFVESPDMMNIYNGIVALDEQGKATVEMPGWFEALNSDFRYQLTALDSGSPNLHIAQRLKDRKFQIAGGQSGQEVSWQVTGIRQDAWAKANRIPVEEDKRPETKGKFLHPELFDKTEKFRAGV